MPSAHDVLDTEGDAMPDFTSQRHPRALAVLALAPLLGILALAGVDARGRATEDDCTRFVRIGDALAKVGGTAEAIPRGPRGLTARTAYLLAFHAAQDTMHADRMATAAARLDAIGERDLARHLRRASATLPAPGEAPP